MAAVLIFVVVGLAAIETGWAKNRLRAFIVSQANQYLTATLEIGHLEGSLWRGIRLGDIRLSRDGEAIIAIDEVSLNYSVRELYQSGTVIRRISLTRPRFIAATLPDGRWNLGALIKRDAQQGERRGPGRPIDILAIDIIDGKVLLRDPLQFGAAYVPTDFQQLNATFSLKYRPVTWTLAFERAAFVGREPDLTVTTLSGGIANGSEGWRFDDLRVSTPRSSFVLAGRVDRTVTPTILDLQVRADRFAFQEWSGILHGLQNIAIETMFVTHLKGPLDGLETSLQLDGTGGSVNGSLTLDTRTPGWRGVGALDVAKIDLARWLNNPSKPSDITGRLKFDLDLNLGHFPRGAYTFDGPHAGFMEYAADNVHADGRLTDTETIINRVAGVAYGARVSAGAGSTIALDAPYRFHFQGDVDRIDLRNVPASIPVPHVESTLTLGYDITGRFSDSYIIGRAAFRPSVFLGAAIADGASGTIDTQADPVAYSGEGDLSGIDVNRFGRDLDVAWMREPRYAGTISGHFKAEGAGSGPTVTLTGGGRITRAQMFHGSMTDGDVGIEVAGGTLTGSYSGNIARIDPAIAMDDPQYAASLTGTATLRATVRDLLVRSPELTDYDVTALMVVEGAEVRGFTVDRGRFRGALVNGVLRVDELESTGPAVAGSGTGRVSFVEAGISDVTYDFSLLDLSRLRDITGQDARGLVATKGRLTGPYPALRLVGTAGLTQLNAAGVDAPTVSGDYDVTIPSGDTRRAQARVEGTATFPIVFGQEFQQATGTLTMAAERVGFDVRLSQAPGRHAGLKGNVVLHDDRRALDLSDLTVTFGNAPWTLDRAPTPATISWTDTEIAVQPVAFSGGPAGDQRIEIAGTWREDGNGALKVTGRQVFLETLEGAFDGPARYGGTMDVDAVLRGTRDLPIVTGQISIVNGRVQRVAYEQLAGRVDYADSMLTVDLRLDQAAGIWLTAKGTAPMALFRTSMPDRPLDLAIASSPIELGLIEGLTDLIDGVSGQMTIDMKAVGTSRDPHFSGTLDLTGTAFRVTASGSRYKNARAAIRFASDRIMVDALHIEDSHGDPLDVQGSLATHELQVGDLEIDAVARHFELVRNEYGSVEADAQLRLRGRFEQPRLGGTVTISSGDLNVDRILERALFQPYSTEPVSIADVDAVAALNPWERMGLDVELRVPNTLKLSGDNVQIATGTPIGLGDINLRVAGDLYVYKDPGNPAYVTGSFDSISGSYGFQGRSFDVDPTSSINFRGDLNPEIYVTVKRVISGVETRVTIAGPLQSPELRLASTPPLDATDILSLIVFNTSANQLTAGQQEELAVRAGALAAGFLATPLLSAVQSRLGLDILQIETSTTGASTGARITIGDEIAPGLVARFSRQFGADPYDEVIVEYYLSRILRLRATFSDAQTLNTRAPFQRRERAGIDLLFFFSF